MSKLGVGNKSWFNGLSYKWRWSDLLDVDSSGFGRGEVLSQIQDDRKRFIAYASRALSKAEKNTV
jgi:hypothetical protein